MILVEEQKMTSKVCVIAHICALLSTYTTFELQEVNKVIDVRVSNLLLGETVATSS